MRETIAALVPEITALRHEFHGHPEIRFEEAWTSDRIAAFLEEAGIPFERGYAKGTGIVATLAGEGRRCVALRSDIDALEIEEKTGLPYASKIPHRMHACGHDGHMACLCGVAKTLAAHRDELGGTVKFIFQPAEELGAGGRYMVEEGALEGVDAVFALHTWPTLPVGKLMVGAGLVMASTDMFTIEVTGKGGHAANPGTFVDPGLIAAHIVVGLQSIVSREMHPREAGVVSVTRIASGTNLNVIPDVAVLEGTIRALDSQRRGQMIESLERIALSTAEAFGGTASVRMHDTGYPPLYNDPAMSEFAGSMITEQFGEGALLTMEHPYMVSEDFAFYLEKVPGAYFFLGNDAAGAVGPPLLHSPQFNFNDEAIPVAIETMTKIAVDFLERV